MSNKPETPESPQSIAVPASELSLLATDWSERLACYVTLAKLRITTVVMASVAVGFTLASTGPLDLLQLAAAMLGIGVAAVASSMLNQWYERHTDALMLRTEGRPLAAGRVPAAEVFRVGVALAVLSTVWLALTVNPLTAALSLFTCVMYVAVYTPLKPRTTLCTTIGAIPGAMPLMLGWTAAGAGLTVEAWVLFAILFVWQFPHFLAIAWIYQDQYKAAGLKMLPANGSPVMTGLVAVSHAAALLPVTLWARSVGMAGEAYALSAVILGCWYLIASVWFAGDPCRSTAKRLVWTSLAYLPMLLAALTIDHVRMMR